jgi:serine phosphatase RsbU (regulator of sigma subunit)
MYLIRKGELKVFRGDRMPIGIYNEEEVCFTNKEVPFKENDIIYLFTDGYVDQIGGPHRKTFKSKQFKELLKDIHQKPMEEQQAILREEHAIWGSGQEQTDDVMILGVKLSFKQSD